MMVVMVTYNSTSVTSAPRLLALAARGERQTVSDSGSKRCLPDEVLAATAAILSLSICNSDIS